MILDRSIHPITQEIDNISLVYPQPQIMVTGHQVYLDTFNTNLASIKFIWFHGYNTKPKLVSSVLSALMFTGTSNLNAHEINKMMKMHGCTYQFNINETYSELALRCLSTNYSEVLPDFLNLFLDAKITEIEFKAYIQAKISEHKSKLNTPGYWSNENLRNLEFEEDHIYGRKIELQDYEKLKLDAVASLLKEYSLQNCALFIGGQNPTKIWEQTFPFLENHSNANVPENPAFDYLVNSKKTGETIEHKVINTNQIALKASYLTSAFTQDEFNKLQLINIVLGGFFGSRLMQEVREKKGLTYGIGTSINQSFGLYNFRISSQMNAANKKDAIEAIVQIIQTLQKNGINEEEFIRAKRYYLGQLYATLDNPGNISEKIIYARSVNMSENAFEQKCKTVLTTSLKELNMLVKCLVDIEKLNWSLAGDV